MEDIQRRVSSLPPEMQELLRQRLAGQATRREIAARPSGAAPVLSFAQQRLWLLDQLHPGSARYNIPGVIHIAGRCDPAAIRHSLGAIVARHEVLRTVYPAERGQPVQRILPTAEPELPVHDLRGLPAAERAAAAEHIGLADAHRPFDLERGPVIRAALVLVEDERAELHITVHHIAADGWSLRVLLREFAALYAAAGHPAALAPLGIQYADYAAWQRGALVGAALDRPLAYWRERLHGVEAAAHLPTDLPRPGRPAFRGALHRSRLPGALADALRVRAAEADATLFMVLLAAFQLLLGRHARGADVAVGTPVAGRGRVELEPLIGLFANTLVLRGDLSGDPSFRALVARTRSRVLEALQHQDLPFEQIVEQLQPDRDPARNPLFQVSFALQPTLSGNEPGAEHGISFELRELEAGLARFDLECHVFERDGGLEVCLVRDTALFRAQTADRLAAEYHALLAAIAEDPARSLSEMLAGIGVADGRAWLAGDAAPEEIEAALLGHLEIDDAAVVVRQTPERSERVAYVVSAAPVERLQAELRDRLPRALWPDVVTAVASLPLTERGEVDAAVLAGLPVLDAATRAAAEAWAQEHFGPEAVARVRDAEVDVPRVHLASLVPELVTAAAPRPAPPAPAYEAPASGPLAISHGGPLAAAADLPRNLAAALDRAADRHPDHGVAYLMDGGAVLRQTYPELRDEAARILAGLQAAGLRPGQPVMFQLDRNQDFVPVLWACMRGGLVAVPLAVPPAYEANAATQKLRAAWELLGRPVVVARDELAAPLRALSGELAFPELALRSVEALRRGDAATARLHDADPDELALLLLTSGSTGTPKAVMLRHRNAIWRSVASAEANGFTPADVSFNWMPLDHVGGVVMFHIRDVCLGAQQIHASTQAILRQPTRWLDEVERHRATITWAPNFAFGLVNEQVERHPERRWDLSALRHILNGGEAVVARTARRFLALLAPHGLPATAMKPAWGMSETSSGVTDSHGFRVASTRDDDPFVEVGAPIPGVSLRIVDGDDRVVPEGAEGRLQIRGETVTAGYYRNAAVEHSETGGGDPDGSAGGAGGRAPRGIDRESFTADGWYRTGDLGVLRAGRLTITGREKDVIIIHGVNYYSHEIEAVVEAVPGVEPSFAAACGVREPGRDTDDLAIFIACAASDPAAQQAVAHEIRGRVARSVGISPRVVLPIAREDFPKTGIGKIQRPQLRARFETGGFDAARRALDLRDGNERTLPGWFYRPAWRPRRGVARPLAPADIVVFLDEAGLGARLGAALDCTGHTCFRVAAGAALRRTGERCFEVDPGDLAQMSALWPALADAGCTAARVVFLPGYDAVPGLRALAVSRDAPGQGTRAVFGLLRSLAAAHAPRPAELFVVTRGGLAARADDPLAGDLAPVSGLLASATQELTGLTCRHVDLGGTAEEDELALWSELELAATDRRVAHRGGVRLVPRLERVDPGDDAAAAPIRIARGGLYLLVGGLGGIGARLAATLRRVYDARVLIAGRRAEPGWRDALADAAPELRGAGALDAISYASLDAGDPAALAGVVAAAEARAAAPLEGIFHLAGAFAERPLAEETWDGLWEVMRAKVLGGLAVHELLAARPGAFAVHVSSVNGWFGGAGVAAYAAANSFLDGLAHGQRRAGLRSASLAFSMWDEVGMSRGYARRALSRARGYAVLSPEQGLASLLAGLRAGAGHLLIGLDAAARPMQRWLGDAPTAAGLDVYAPDDAGAASAPPRDRFGVAIPVRRLPLAALPGQAPDAGEAGEPGDLERRLLAIWHEVLGSDRFGVDGNFFELGGHSLLATQLLARINQALGVDLPLSALFLSPTVRGLATAVRDVRPADAERGPAPAQLSHDPAGRHEPFPLTDVQQAYWIGRTGHFALGGVGSHEYMELDCPGLDVPRLEQAWQHLIERHDMLRAVVLPDGRQQVRPTAPPYPLRALDLRGLPGPEAAARLAEVRREMSHRVLPADRCPIFELRASLLDGDRARLHVSIDALIMDAWSFSVLSRELVRLYAEPEAALPALAIQFRDHVVAEAAQRGSEAYRRADAYWRARIASLPPAPALPLARPPSEIAAPRFVRRDGRLSPAAWGAIKRRASRAGVTPSAVLLTAFAEVLGAFSQGPRFTLNLTLFNRPARHPQIADVVGDFTSLILFEVDLGAPAGFEERARATQARLWADLEHSAVSGIEVLRALARARGALGGAAMPVVFSSALGMEDERGDTHALERLGEVTYAITQTPQVWLDHGVWEQGGALVFNWDAVDGLFPDGLLDAAFAAYRRLLDALAGEAAWQAASRAAMALPDPLAGPPVIPADAPPGTLYSRFADQAARRPAATAVVSSRRNLTYDELRRASRALGRRLRAAGARPGALVAVVMERGWEQVVAVLGVAASGAAYLPIDAGAPTARRHQLLADAGATLVVTQPWLVAALAWPADATIVTVHDAVDEAVNNALALDDGPELAAVAAPDDLAYVIYTSGSTGQPKGVMIDHRGAVNTLVDINRRFGVTPDDRVLAVSSLTFDLSVYDVFGTLAAGAAVVLPDAAAGPDPAHWAELVRRHGVTIWNSVPALFQMLVEYAAGRGAAGDRVGGSLRLALLSGDWIPVRLPDDARRLIPGLEVVSLGGATEASIWSVLYPIARVDPAWTSIPYGRAMDHQRIYVLGDVDRGLEACPPGVPGELYIGGIGVARGYRGDPARTAARFLCHPRTGERLYRTGDFGRYLPDGNIEFLGRQDDQIKLRGYRIELGEIEAAIALHPAVAACAVAVVGSGGDRSLAAYVVWRGAGAAEALRGFLVERLPGYMVPASITGLAQLPLTANGKVDRRALPPPAAPADAIAPGAAGHHEAPAAETGSLVPRIARAVAELLELDASPEDDLFALGITSIGVIRLVNRLEQELGLRPRFDDVYRQLTIAGLARLYERERGGLEPPAAVRPPASRTLPDAPRIDDPEAREAFKRRRVALRPPGGAGVALPSPDAEPFTRRSVRHYSTAPVPLAALGRLLDGLRQLDRDGVSKARYASAGGLYPVQAYLHIQPGRVEGVGGGAYYYHPIEHRLVALAPGAALDPAIHEPLVNRPVFERAALSIFLVLEPRAIAPLYGEWSIPFATLEAGMMSQVLAARAAGCGLGLCDIGWVEPGPVHRILRLSDDCVLLHSLVGGVPAEPAAAPGQAGPGQAWEEGEL